MITKQQALTATEFHYHAAAPCQRHTGPRGGIELSVWSYQRNGKTKTWKRDPSRWRIPIKRGLYDYAEITNLTAGNWHTAETCPLLEN